MNQVKRAKLGILYIFWILAAWSFVGLYKFIFIETVSNLDESISALAKESIRFFVFIGPIIAFIMCNFSKPWYRWLGLYGCKRGTLFKTIVVSFLYPIIGSIINIYGFHKLE